MTTTENIENLVHVVAAHLMVLSGVDVPLVWVPTAPFETPGCYAVRDAFLDQQLAIEATA